MTRFHSDEYIDFLRVVTPDNMGEHHASLSRFNILEDCPVFDGLWEYCQIAAGGSLAGAARLNSGESSTVINWAGGLHHAKRAEASGFCYINDCVLAILELLKVHARVLYVDIDIHHGDGVEEAFYTTDRVMTVSFHKYGDYFPGTGDVSDVGTGRGKNYSVNFPLKDGVDDESYRYIFHPVMTKVMEWYQPGAVVLQCGADSLSGDRLGCFNLSLRGHAQCVDFFADHDVPILMLGGGGYTIRNVARCWAYETSRVLNADITDELPFNDNYEFYGPEFRLHIPTSNMENHNTRSSLDKTKARILEQLRQLPHVPATPFIDVPRSAPLGLHIRDYDSDNEDPDVRKKSRRAKTIPEYDDSDDDDDQYLTSLRVARRKVRKSSFPRRSAPRIQRTTATTASMHSPSAAVTSDTYHTPPAPSYGANGVINRVSHAGLLVGDYGTAATSDERVEPGPPHASDDNVDSSRDANRASKRKDKADAAAITAKRARPLEDAPRWPDARPRDNSSPTAVDKKNTVPPSPHDSPGLRGTSPSPEKSHPPPRSPPPPEKKRDRSPSTPAKENGKKEKSGPDAMRAVDELVLRSEKMTEGKSAVLKKKSEALESDGTEKMGEKKTVSS